jgi:hypothetical protein
VEPVKLVRFLTSHRLRHERALERYETLEAQLHDTHSGRLDALQFGIAYERAMLDWLGELLKRL